jgi:hypothetical protein
VFTISIDLSAGEYLYKYIVDGIWMTNKTQVYLNDKQNTGIFG